MPTHQPTDHPASRFSLSAGDRNMLYLPSTVWQCIFIHSLHLLKFNKITKAIITIAAAIPANTGTNTGISCDSSDDCGPLSFLPVNIVMGKLLLLFPLILV